MGQRFGRSRLISYADFYRNGMHVNMDKILPLGSVVLLKGGEKPLIICGRVQRLKESGEWYEYSGCFFPEGFTAADEMNLFNGKSIEKVIQYGYQDDEEAEYEKTLEKILAEIADKS